jgi:hypothetical protein
MVKLGFIVEGASEKAILKSSMFRSMLANLKLDYVENVIDAKGNGKLLPELIQDHVEYLESEGATQILILTDQEDAPCITSVKARINPEGKHIVVVAAKAIEAWLLADSKAISTYFGKNFKCDYPESFEKPFQHIKTEKLKLTNRGVNDKGQLCSRILASGLSLEAAAAHPNCPSAKYFLDKLTALSSLPSPNGN